MLFKDISLSFRKNTPSFFLLSILLISIIWEKTHDNFPIPTEIIERKKNRKKFKQNRKEWMANMHLTAPNIDWKKMDQESREKQVYSKTSTRKGALNSQIERNAIITQGQWHERGSNNQAGRIRTSFIDYENDEIYCASSGGNIWRGGIDGSNWVSLNDYFQIKGIHFLYRFDYLNTTRMIMVNDKNVYRTDDDGYVIEPATGLESVQEWGWIFRALRTSDDNGEIYLAAIEWDYDAWTYMPSIYKSIDDGESFIRILELTDQNGFIVGTSHFDIWISSGPNNDLIILNDGYVYTLNRQTNETSLISNIDATVSGSNIIVGGQTYAGDIYLHSRIGNVHYSSMDAGLTWQNMGELPTGTFTINSFECSKSDPNRLAIGNVDGYFSNNGGQTWQMINNWWEYYSSPDTKLHADLPELSYNVNPDNSEEFQMICTDGGIYISFDHFQTVENLSLSGLGVSQYYSTYTSKTYPYHVFAGSQDQGFQRHLSEGSYNGVLDFEQTISGDYGHIVSADGGVSLWTDYPGFVMYYPDAANSTNMTSWDFQGSGYLWLPPLMNDPSQPNIVYIGGGGINSLNHMVKVTYLNGNMIAEDLDYTFPSKISAMGYSPVNLDQWYVSTETGSFFFSTDGGQNFSQTTSFSGPESHYFYGSTILPSPVNEQRVYIGGSGYSNPGVYISENGGQSFSEFDEGLPNTMIYQLACLPDESILFAATELGPYAYSFDEESWLLISEDDAPDQVYWSVEYIEEINTVRYGTYGRGIWDYQFNHDPTIAIGDLNEDDNINEDDMMLLISIILSGQLVSDQTINLGNLDYDDSLDIFDLLLLVDLF